LQKPKTTRTLSIQSVVTKPHNAAENPKQTMQESKQASRMEKRKVGEVMGSLSFFPSHFRLCKERRKT
jgi:hypothetical protein